MTNRVLLVVGDGLPRVGDEVARQDVRHALLVDARAPQGAHTQVLQTLAMHLGDLVHLVVDEVQGFRRFTAGELIDHWPQTEVRAERYISGAYQRGEEIWPVFNFYELLESSGFLQASAE